MLKGESSSTSLLSSEKRNQLRVEHREEALKVSEEKRKITWKKKMSNNPRKWLPNANQYTRPMRGQGLVFTRRAYSEAGRSSLTLHNSRAMGIM